jgi:NAD(P)H-hydrate epimerase
MNIDVPFLSTAQMVEVDRAMIEDYHIELIQMMENAGRNLAHLARKRFLSGDPKNKLIVILAGTGGNGGGALVCARRLHNYGAEVQILVTKPEESFSPVSAQQIEIVRRMAMRIYGVNKLKEIISPDLIIDGIIGYSLKGAPRGNAAKLIRWANEQNSPTLSLDTPSGIDTTSGKAYDPSIRAAATMTLALPKEGLRTPIVRDFVGELYLADISVPPGLYSQPPLSLEVETIFSKSDIVRLW